MPYTQQCLSRKPFQLWTDCLKTMHLAQIVIPAKAGTHNKRFILYVKLDSRLRGNDRGMRENDRGMRENDIMRLFGQRVEETYVL